MALVNNASGVYTTLGYNFSDPNGAVQNFSSNTQSVMSQLPPLIKTWQAQDIANNTVGNYFQNPVTGYINTIITASQNMFTAANSANIFDIAASANALTITASNFLVHTNKVSGVTSIVGATDTNVNPYYQTAVNYGKQAIYITNQTDGIVNNSPILGCMTSILVGPQIGAGANTISNDLIILNAAITANNLSPTQESQINGDLANLNSLLVTRQSSDVTFFGNLITFINNYNTTQQFANMGETETYLVNNLIGTPSLVSKINS
jgi:hypothetical protein